MIRNTVILLILTCIFVDAADTDGDGLDDAVETKTGVYVSPSNTGTDPQKPDTDGDSVNDGQEVIERTSPVNSNSVHDFSRNTVAFYPFSSNGLDASGNGHHRGENIKFGPDRFGAAERACTFIDSRLVPLPAPPDNKRTLTMWVKIIEGTLGTISWPNSPVTGRRRLVGFVGPLGGINFTDNGYMTMDSGNGVSLFQVGIFPEWSHIAVVYEGSIRTAKVYRDGVLIPLAWWGMGSKEDTGLPDLLVKADNWLIDDMRIYNRVLSQREISDLRAFEFDDDDEDKDGIVGRHETGTGVYVSPEDTGTSPTDPDSDRDGLTDGDEIFIHGTNPNLADVDSDDLSDGDEVIVFGTDPSVADTDKDGITDGEETGVGVFSVVDGIFTWEQARVDAMAKGGRLATFGSALEWQGALRSIGSDALVGRIGIWLGATDQVEEGSWRWVTGEPFTFQNWAEGEPDNANDSDFADVAGTELAVAGKWYDRRSTAVRDGYLLEKGHASSPLKADSDDDGLNDREEKVAGSHPLMADTDSDGLNDVHELRLSQTSPVNSDTDGDGMVDAQEDPDGDGLTHAQEIIESKTNPLVADTDSDGFDDRFELVSGFDPTRGDSTPDAITTILPAVEFRFNAAVGVSYRIEGSDDLQNWTVIEPAVIGQGGVVTRLYSIEAHPTRYLRVRRN